MQGTRMKTQLRYRVCDEDGTLRRFATRTEAVYFIRCREDLRILVDKKRPKDKPKELDVGEAVF